MAGSNGNSGGNGKAGGNGHPRGPVPAPKPDPPDLDAEIRKAMFEVLSKTGNRTLASRVAGISIDTYRRWLEKGHLLEAKASRGERVPTPHLKFLNFARTVDQALAEWEREQIETIRKAAAEFDQEEDWAEQWQKGEETRTKLVKKKRRERGDWRAAAWLLEKRFPKKYGKRQEIDVKGGMDLVAVLTELRDEQESGPDHTNAQERGGGAVR